MAKKDYIPTREGKLINWLKNYRDKLPAHAAALGLNAAELAAQIAFCNGLIDALADNTQAQQDAQQARADADAQYTTSITGVRKAAQKGKKADGYTPAIGEDLGIVGEERTVDIENSQPKLTARRVETGTELKFSLQNFFTAVKIFRQRPGGGAKEFIAVDTSSPYLDSADQVDGTQYTAWFQLGDATVGIESDPVVVQV